MSSARSRRSRPVTADEFLAWPGDGRAKHYEFVDGEVRAMSPASVAHSLLQGEILGRLHQHLRVARPGCRVLPEAAVQPRLRADMNVRVPDLAVTCAPIRQGQILVDDPVLLIEILSPFNKAKTWTNVWAFTTIPSVQEIVVVHSTRIEVQVLRSSAERVWPERPEIVVEGGTLRLQSIGFECPVDDLYDGLTFG